MRGRRAAVAPSEFFTASGCFRVSEKGLGRDLGMQRESLKMLCSGMKWYTWTAFGWSGGGEFGTQVLLFRFLDWFKVQPAAALTACRRNGKTCAGWGGT